MTNDKFLYEVEKAINRSNELLIKKNLTYTFDEDRLINFKQVGAMELCHPTESLMSMMNKHVARMSAMVKNPDKHSRKEWNSVLDDIRNYTLLCDALLIDIGIE